MKKITFLAFMSLYHSWAFATNTTAISPLPGNLGSYRHIFSQGNTLGVQVTSSHLFTNDRLAQKGLLLPSAFFDKRTKDNFMVTPTLNFGKMMDDHFHVMLGLGLAITQRCGEKNNRTPDVSQTSKTRYSFVPSVSAEYIYTKNISFVGNISYEKPKNQNSALSQNASAKSSYWSVLKPKFLSPRAGIVYRF